MAMGLGYKPMVNDNISSRQNEHLFQDEIEDLVKRHQSTETQKMKVSIFFLNIYDFFFPILILNY